MATISPTPKLQFLDVNGDPLSYGLLYTYAAGTTFPAVTYTTAAQTTANTNPIVLDARGEANVWLTAGSAYKFVLQNSSGVLQYTVDQLTAAGTMSTQNANAVAITGGTISGVSISGPITGTVTGNVVGDVSGNLSGNVVGGTVSATSYNGGQLAGLRNKIINGAININQRKPVGISNDTGSGTSTRSNSVVMPDRWSYVSNTTAILKVSQEAAAPANSGLNFSLNLFTSTADASPSATEYFSVVQVIEGYEIKSLVNKTFTLSFWVKSAVTGSYSIALWNGAWAGLQDRFYVAEYTISAANTWEYKTITIADGLPSSGSYWNFEYLAGLTVAWNLYAGSTYRTSATNSWDITPILASNSQVNAIGTNGNVFALAGVQLEIGSVATPFENRPFPLELGLCHRYYEKSFVYSAAPVQNYGSTENAAYGIAAFPNQAFAANVTFTNSKPLSPGATVVTYAPDALTANWSTNTTTPTATVVNLGDRGFAIRGSTSTSAGNAYSIHWSANAEL